MISHSADIVTNDAGLSCINIPPVIFDTSCLGNLLVATGYATKLKLVKECIEQSNEAVVFDTAGKYGAGLALETLGRCLKELNVKPEGVIISNKLGRLRTEPKTEEPTFESGAWKDLKYDAVQKISYDGIIECFEQGNCLLNGYIPQMVSVHDPDEYLATAKNEEHAKQLYEDILDAFEALYDLKQEGKVKAVGVRAKDWKVIQRIAKDVELDWVMLANSLTIKNHSRQLLDFVKKLTEENTLVINSAVFHSGFLVGGNYYDHELIIPNTHENKALFQWREDFFKLCDEFAIKPAKACVQFALSVPGVASVALGTSEEKRVKENIQLPTVEIPNEFWIKMKDKGLISKGYPYLG